MSNGEQLQFGQAFNGGIMSWEVPCVCKGILPAESNTAWTLPYRGLQSQEKQRGSLAPGVSGHEFLDNTWYSARQERLGLSRWPVCTRALTFPLNALPD